MITVVLTTVELFLQHLSGGIILICGLDLIGLVLKSLLYNKKLLS